jgi:hypothetical protein
MNATIRREQVDGLREMVAELTARVERAEADRAALLAALERVTTQCPARGYYSLNGALKGYSMSVRKADMDMARTAIDKARRTT